MNMNRPPLAYVTGYLQFSVAIIFLLGYFALLAILFLGKSVIPDNLLELAKTLAIGLTNALGLLFAFLYLRSRTDGTPDPSTSTVDQTTVVRTLPTQPTGAPTDATPAPTPVPSVPPAAVATSG